MLKLKPLQERQLLDALMSVKNRVQLKTEAPAKEKRLSWFRKYSVCNKHI